MTYLTVTEAKAHLLDIIRKADSSMQHFIITKSGKPKAIIMSLDEYEGWLETLEIMSDKKALKDIRKAEKELAQGKSYTFDQVFKKMKRRKKR